MLSFWWRTCSRCIRPSVRGGLFDAEVTFNRDGLASLLVVGPGANQLFANESGGHRWQRIPPTEKRGRVQTSTVTVAVLGVQDRPSPKLLRTDVDEMVCRGSGKGGQNRNKRDTAVQLRHRPTGIIVRHEIERSQHANRKSAWEELTRRVTALAMGSARADDELKRRQQVGSGERGDKRRTYRTRDDCVTDHVTGKKASLSRVISGELELLW